MKILTVVGARPQFIKAAAVSRELRKKHTEIIVHTGQHYDTNMSEIFFDELDIPAPDYNLGVGSGTHAFQTAQMMMGIEKLLISQKPDYLLVYGDTNSTLAGALAASKLLIPVIHVEAGLRSFNMNMPEEQNRILTDRISEYLFCPTQTAVDNLKRENITKGVYNVGDVMCDAVNYYAAKAESYDKKHIFSKLKALNGDIPHIDKWYLATVHRAENTDNDEKIYQILAAFERFDEHVIFPVHPRTKKQAVEAVAKNGFRNTVLVEPIGYLEMLFLAKHALKIITDSGGLQKEAYILRTPCVTIRDQTEWVETLNSNMNILAKTDAEDIYDKTFNTKIDFDNHINYYGEGDAAVKICKCLN